MLNRLAFLVVCACLGTAAAEPVSDRSIFVGGSVDVNEAVAGPVHGAGGRITVNAAVGGSARLAGGSIELGPSAAISENASLAGGKVVVSGSVKGNLHAAGGDITIDGPVGGDASVAAGTLHLGPNARIAGNLRFRGGRLERDPGAQVAGTIEQTSRHTHDHRFTPFPHGGGRWVWTAGLMLLAALIAGALPGPSARMAQELRARPWMAPLLGFIALTCIPVAAVLVMITIIGIPLGLLALLGYAALLLVGYVCVSVVVGGLLLDRFKAEVAGIAAWRAGAAMLAMLALALLARVPIVGGFVVFAALIVGVGLIVATTLRRMPQGSVA